MGLLRKIGHYLWLAFHTFFRHYNFPCDLGLRKIGNPTPDSPVFLSGNYVLTVYRLEKLLTEMKLDCYLLVANSRGSNVWCASGMAEFTEYDVVDAIEFAGLRKLVRHRRIIAPPYCAPGVDLAHVRKVTGFQLRWGPVDMDYIPAYLAAGYRRTAEMCQVTYRPRDRIEQAFAVTTAYALTLAVGAIFWPKAVGAVILLIGATYAVLYTFWNVLPRERYFIRSLMVLASVALPLFLLTRALGATVEQQLFWQGACFVAVALVAFDHCGGSATYKTTVGHWLKTGNYLSIFQPIVDPNACKRCGACVDVCPRGVLAELKDRRVVSVAPDRCVECWACVKQCPHDALYNCSGEYKGDVKSVPNAHALMRRDWRHLSAERSWGGKETVFHRGRLAVAESIGDGSDMAPLPSAEEAEEEPRATAS